MQLSYRGTAYKRTQQALPMMESETYAIFLGRRYRVRQVKSLPRALSATELTYRGVKYNSHLSA